MESGAVMECDVAHHGSPHRADWPAGPLVWALITWLLATGCGAHSAALFESQVLRSLAVGEGTTSLVGIETLELPRDGELVLKPRLLSLDASSLTDEVPVRAQIVLRGLRHDGGVYQWFVGADGRAPAGEKAFELSSARASRDGFGGADYGPVRIDALASLAVSVALVPNRPRDSARFMGGGALQTAGAAGDASTATLHRAVEVDEAVLVVASRVPVEPRAEVAPGQYQLQLVFAGTSPASANGVLTRLHTVDGARLTDLDGAVASGVSFLVLELQVEVPDHSQ